MRSEHLHKSNLFILLITVSKEVYNGVPSLHARKRQNLVREMNDQILSTPNEPINDDESDGSDDITDDEIEFVNDKPSTSSKARVEITDDDFSMNEAVPSTSGTQRPKRKVRIPLLHAPLDPP